MVLFLHALAMLCFMLMDHLLGPLLALLQTALRDLISHIDDFATHLLIGPLTSVLQEAMTHGKVSCLFRSVREKRVAKGT